MDRGVFSLTNLAFGLVAAAADGEVRAGAAAAAAAASAGAAAGSVVVGAEGEAVVGRHLGVREGRSLVREHGVGRGHKQEQWGRANRNGNGHGRGHGGGRSSGGGRHERGGQPGQLALSQAPERRTESRWVLLRPAAQRPKEDEAELVERSERHFLLALWNPAAVEDEAQ